MTIEIASALHYLSIAFVIAATSFGVGLGGSYASASVLEALDIQPSAQNDINRLSLVSLALIETSGILAMVIALMLLRMQSTNASASIADCAIALALGITGAFVGYVSAWPTASACKAVARQPFLSQKIMTLFLITMSLIQTPVIFGFLISLLIFAQRGSAETAMQAFNLLSAGICMGIGSIGPCIGLARFAQTACESIGINPRSYSKILPFTFISEAIIETPLIFAMIIALILVNKTIPATYLAATTCLAAAMAIGIGTFGAGINSSKTASAACMQMARTPDQGSLISRVSLIGQALIDAAAIYALLTALLMLIL